MVISLLGRAASGEKLVSGCLVFCIALAVAGSRNMNAAHACSRLSLFIARQVPAKTLAMLDVFAAWMSSGAVVFDAKLWVACGHVPGHGALALTAWTGC